MMTTCRYILGASECGLAARYLVAVPFGEYRPYCRTHMTRVIVHATDEEYSRRPAGEREDVRVLPVDER